MVSSSNGGSSGGNAGKRSLENAYHSLNSGNAPKFKKRKVPAVRDFPPMCGRNVLPINSEAEINTVVSDSAAVTPEPTDVKIDMEAQVQPLEVVGSPVVEEVNESLDILVEKVVKGFTPGSDEGMKQMLSDVKHMGTELGKDLERESEPSKEGNWKDDQASAKESGHGDGVKSSTEVGRLVHWEVSTQKGSVPSPKNKFRRRRVSAVRDFPRYCGRNAPVPSPEDRQKITPEVSVFGVNVDKVVGELRGDEGSTTQNSTLPAKFEKSSSNILGTTVETVTVALAMTTSSEAKKGVIQNRNFEASQAGMVTVSNDACDAVMTEDNEEGPGFTGGEIVLYTPKNVCGSGHEDEFVVVNALMPMQHCPRRQGKVAVLSGDGITGGNANQDKITWRGKPKAVAKKSTFKADSFKRSSLKKMDVNVRKDADDTLGAANVGDAEKSDSGNDVPHEDSSIGRFVGATLPPFGCSTTNGDARKKVRETLRLFQALCRKLLQGVESRPESDTKGKQLEKIKRIDLEASKLLKERGKEVNTGKQYLGAVPGVEVGDEFQYRVELAIVGIHRLYQAGIDYMDFKGKKVATSIVASGGYADDTENPDVLIYSGQGGFKSGKDKRPEDQKLERGNKALWNSVSTKNPVRVIRGSKGTKDSDSQDLKSKMVNKYVYDGLYTVENYWTETGAHGKLVFMFKLRRNPNQPELAWKEVKKSKKSRGRHGVCIDDIAGGNESFPICAINTIDKEKPQPFNYIRKMIYRDSLHLIPPRGCDCNGRCSDSRKCSCAWKNGGEIPYNHNGAIVEVKSLVYECGPHCRCPPSCYNRVSQHGVKIPLEIFKTETRGWGVRSLSSIPSGSFICEYAGEFLEDKEAEKRTGSDEYLFDIGPKGSDGQPSSSEAVAQEGGYTIDAALYGNVGRFINHSCSPNLYAQDVLYDHDDKRMPHVMLFAAENIPPLKELTYDYNYSVGLVHDSKGNVKKKKCFCGATECTGRLY